VGGKKSERKLLLGVVSALKRREEASYVKATNISPYQKDLPTERVPKQKKDRGKSRVEKGLQKVICGGRCEKSQEMRTVIEKDSDNSGRNGLKLGTFPSGTATQGQLQGPRDEVFRTADSAIGSGKVADQLKETVRRLREDCK